MKIVQKTIATFALLLLATSAALAGKDEMRKIVRISPKYEEYIDTLQPEFEWEKIPGSDVTYDFRIFFLMDQGEKPITLYRQDGLKTTRFKPDYKFKPAFTYGWSVRYTKNNEKSDWAYHFKTRELVLQKELNRLIPRFSTPGS